MVCLKLIKDICIFCSKVNLGKTRIEGFQKLFAQEFFGAGLKKPVKDLQLSFFATATFSDYSKHDMKS